MTSVRTPMENSEYESASSETTAKKDPSKLYYKASYISAFVGVVSATIAQFVPSTFWVFLTIGSVVATSACLREAVERTPVLEGPSSAQPR